MNWKLESDEHFFNAITIMIESGLTVCKPMLLFPCQPLNCKLTRNSLFFEFLGKDINESGVAVTSIAMSSRAALYLASS